MLTGCLAVASGCGRFGYDALLPSGNGPADASLPLPDGGDVPPDPGDTPSIPLDARYISPGGDDAAAGTRDAPWRSWNHALGQLRAGDTLVVLDGTYARSTGTGYFYADCMPGGTSCGGQPCASGEAGRPITVQAENERQPLIRWEPPMTRQPLTIQACAHWRLYGLRLEAADDSQVANFSVLTVDHAQQVILSRLLVLGNNRYQNSQQIQITHSSDVLVHESELYGSHWGALVSWYSQRVTLRRNYVHGRGAADIAGGRASYCDPATVDHGIAVWSSSDSVIENNVVEDACNGLLVTSTTEDVASFTPVGDRNRVLGNVGRASTWGIRIRANCNGESPCTTDAAFVRDLEVTDNVVVTTQRGIHSEGAQDLRLRRNTSLDHADVGLDFSVGTGNGGLAADATIDSALAVSTRGDHGFRFAAGITWDLSASNAFGHLAEPYLPAASGALSTTIDPQLGACQVAIPASSPMKGAGAGGSDIGATVRLRYVDGVLTSQPLWDDSSGAFPCGAVIPGVNDATSFPASSCVTVHQRLAVAACP
jgi:hypothetical protein